MIRVRLAWVHPISAPVPSSAARLHHVLHADENSHVCMPSGDRRAEDTSAKFRDTHPREMRASCNAVMSQRDETTALDLKRSPSEKPQYTDKSGGLF